MSRFQEKSYTGNPHVRFDEWEVVPAATPRRGSLLYRNLCNSIFVALLMLFPIKTYATVYTQVVNGVKWAYSISDGKAVLGGLSASARPAVPPTTTGSLTIPDSLGGCSVARIEYGAFEGCASLTHIEIPNSVTKITISDFAFASCRGLKSFSVAAGNEYFTTIDGLLYDKVKERLICCPGGLQSVDIPAGTKTIGHSAFYGNIISSVSIPNGVETISNYAFYGCRKLTSVNLPDTVRYIGQGAFEFCALESMRIPRALESIGEYPFAGCQFSAFEVPNDSKWFIEINGLLCDKHGSAVVVCAPNVRNAVVPDGVSVISDYAFHRCTMLEKVELPTSLKIIGDYAFYWCTSLRTIKLPEGITSVGSYGYTFYGCCNLEKIAFQGVPPSVGNQVFYGVKNGATGTYYAAYKGEWDAVAVNGYWQGLKMEMEKPTYTIVYHVSEGEGKEGAVEDQTCEFGSDGVCADDGGTLHWEWHFFMGWALSLEGAQAGNVDWQVREQICEPTEGNVVNCWDVWKKADFGIRFHGNGGETVDGLDEVKMSFLFGESQGLPDNCFSRGDNRFLGWQTGDAADYNPDSSDNEYHKRRFYSVGTKDFNNFNPPENIDWAEFGDAITWENGVPILHLYAIWTSSLCVKFYDAQKSLYEELTPAYLLNHIMWKYPYGKDNAGTWHVNGDTISNVTPGTYAIRLKIDSGYDQLVHFDDSYTSQIENGETVYFTSIKVESETIGLAPIASLTRTCYANVAVHGGMSEWPYIRFNVKGEEGNDVQNLAPFDPSRVQVEIRKKTDARTISLGKFSVDSPISLPAGMYSASFQYADGRQGWIRDPKYPSALDFSLPVTEDIEVEFIQERDSPFYAVSDGNLTGVVANNSVSITLSGEVKNVSATAFVGCEGLEEIVFEGDAPTVEDGAFAGLENCRILVSCNSIGWGVNIPGTWNGMRIEYFDEKPQPVFTIVGTKVLKAVELNGATEVVIPDGVTDIMPQAFSNCSNLTSVVIPDSTEHIWYRAFYRCSDLVSVTIPDSVARIDYNAFCECNDLLFDTETIPGVKLVDGWAVGHTDLLSGSLDLTGVRGIGISAFSGCPGLTCVSIPDNVTNVAAHAFYRCDGLSRVNLGRGVATIGKYAFSNCRIEEFTVPTNNAFYKASAGLLLTKDGATLVYGVTGDVVIPDGVVSIGENAFNWCRGLTSVTIPSSVTSIGAWSFAYCYSVSEVRVPVSVKRIEDSAFRGCQGLKKVLLPQTLRGAVDASVFADCHTELEIVYYGEDDICINIKEMQETGDDGSFSLDIGSQLVSVTKPKLTVRGLPTGLKFDSNAGMISGKATKPGVYTVTVSATNATVKKPVTATFELTVPNLVDDEIPVADEYGPYIPGKAYVETIVAAAGCAVTGLPVGMKWTAKAVTDKTVGTVPANSVYGAATKPGNFTVYFTKTMKETNEKGKQVSVKHTATATFVVGPFPKLTIEVVGTGTGKVTGAGEYAANKKVTLKATANTKDAIATATKPATVKSVFMGWYDGETLLSQSASYSLVMPETDTTLTAKFVTAQEDKESITLAVAASDDTEPFGLPTNGIVSITNFCGVAMNWQLAANALSATTIKVAGLPAGLKFTAKDIVDSKTKQVTVPANTIYGAPTAASKTDRNGNVTPSKVVFTVTTAGKSTQTFQIDLYIDPLPAWAVGSFDGATDGGDGVVTATVAANGKVTAKVLVGGATLSLSAASFDSVERPKSEAESPVFLATLVGKVGKALVTNEVGIASAVVDGVTVGVVSGVEVSETPVAWTALQNLWKRADTKGDMPVFKTSFDRTVELGEKGDADNAVKLTFKKDGAVSFTGKVGGVKVSGSSQLVNDGTGWSVTFYAPPPKGSSAGFCKTFAVKLTTDKQNIVTKVELGNEPEMVRLWEGGPYWATKNIGAEKPEDYGYYFWWGDTVGYKRENDQWVASDGTATGFSFSEENAPTYGKDGLALYNEGWITADGVLAPEYDAAQVQLGGGWRLPTKQELSDLDSKCDWTLMMLNGVTGCVISGRGSYAANSIFFPCAGYSVGVSLNGLGSGGLCWSSVPDPGGYSPDGSFAWFLNWSLGVGSVSHYMGSYISLYRYYGFSIRPVQDAE